MPTIAESRLVHGPDLPDKKPLLARIVSAASRIRTLVFKGRAPRSSVESPLSDKAGSSSQDEAQWSAINYRFY